MSVGLAETFRPEAIVIGLKNRTKDGVIAELVQHLVRLGDVTADKAAVVVENIVARERVGSSALYDGVAFPHCRSALVERFVGVLGIEPGGIPFDAVGGGLVHGVFLFLAPLEQRRELYELLGRIAAIGRDKSRRAQLRGCRTPEAAHCFLRTQDQ
jgi:mannitol/fructose-specific phosphotransferase system IIA component (Ntr-type)